MYEAANNNIEGILPVRYKPELIEIATMHQP